MNEYAIEIKNVSKSYDSKNFAVDNLSLNITKGKFFALLGPNGAGKSTLINMIGNTVKKTSGDIWVNGYNIDTHTRSAKRSIGIVPQELNLDPFFTAYESLKLQSGLFGVKRSKRELEHLLDSVGLLSQANSPARSLSGGMRRRLLVAKSMVHQPKVLILDEPTAGVDIQFKNKFMEVY